MAVRDKKITFRRQVQTLDSERIGRLTQSTGFFTEAETEVAQELIDEALAKGESAGYLFVFAESQGEVVGYVCYGHIACTLHGYDIYWIVVSPAYQGLGLGRALLDQAENLIRGSGGKHAYIETSARAQYLPTRGFYLRCGYEEIARLSEFYAPADDKIIYRKIL
jgi:ribosomal protein S18 acetylase RimI-like enzyme